MPKKDKNSKKSAKGGTADAVRGAVERAFEGAGVTQKRTREVVDEVAHAAARVRAALEDLRLLEDVRGLKAEVEALASRVAALEGAARPARSTGRSTAARAKAATPATRSTKSAGTTAQAAKPAGRATKSAGTTTRAKSAGTRSTRSSGGTTARSAKAGATTTRASRSSGGTGSSGSSRSSAGRS
jgi:hypothetical protein